MKKGFSICLIFMLIFYFDGMVYLVVIMLDEM